MIPSVPAMPASIAAFVMVLGLGLIYWGLVGTGALVKTGTPLNAK